MNISKRSEYQIEKRKFNHAYWITAPDSYLSSLETFPEGSIPLGSWIWPKAYVRVYMRYDFTISKPVKKAELQFQCDNEFSIYINGKELPAVKGKPLWHTDILDITGLISEGENKVGICAYQTGVPDHFTSALRGGIQLSFTDGSSVNILTGKDWTSWKVCNFYEEKVQVGWETSPKPGEKWETICTQIHPRLKRRSCYIRKSFRLSEEIEGAILRGTALGFYEAQINGQKVGDGLLQPGSIEKYKEYQEFDVTSLLSQGNNIIGIIMGNGWLNCRSWGELKADKPSLLLELELKFRDGHVEYIGTDESWMTAKSPIIDNDLQFGERYDARQETPSLNDWTSVEVIPGSLDKETIVLQNYEPVRVTEVLKPLSMKEISKGVYLFDFGQNAAGRARLKIRNASKGTKIIISYYERLEKDNEPCIYPYVDVYFPSDNKPDGKSRFSLKNYDTYICNGNSFEVYEPRFTYTGFRYLSLEGYPKVPDIDSVEYMVMHTDLPVTGRLESSYSPIMDIWKATTWSYRSNIHTGPTDCPTREKNFWNGDIQAFSDTACWYMDNSRFLARWTDAGRKLAYGIYGWEDEEYILPWKLYRFYDDIGILRIKYPVILKLVEKRQAKIVDILPDGSDAPWRDHLAVENVPADFYGACYYCLMLKIVAKIAQVLGHTDDSVHFESMYNEASRAFNEKFYESEEANYSPHCQGGIIFPLAFGLVPEDDRTKASNKLAEYVAKCGYHPTTGFMSTAYLLPLLCDYGYEDTAWKTLSQEEYPSWRYILSTGATTMTVNWKAQDPVRVQTSKNPSMNHFALGSVCQWFFEYLGGIRLDESENAFKKFVFKPVFIKEIGKFKAYYNTAYGDIVSSWDVQMKDGLERIRWEITIPPSTTARVVLPGCKEKEYTEGKYELFISGTL